MPDAATRLNAALEGRYEIERELGEGGMATVYLAKDLKHNRNVALKVLRPELAAVVGAERFLAEIETTANLQHPHILPLFDSGEADSFLFYVMPYVEGETLRDRLDRDHQLPVDEAVRIASDIAEALAYAHGHGVIHRDIKPANILIHSGRPVLSDFGIALAVGAAGGGRLTETGLSLGTPHYMSPEQATGDLSVGAATDVYALGCVLYEMLVGEPPYTGSTAQAILGKIIAGELATATKQRASVPPNVDAAIRKALEKLPADRFTRAQDFARALGDSGFRHGELAVVGATERAGPWNRLTVGFAGLATLLAATVVVLMSRPLDPTTAQVVRYIEPVGQGADLFLSRQTRTTLTLSPDGELLVYAAQGEDTRLYMRRLGQFGADPIVGTDGATSAFFSPNGDWIGFFDGGALRRVSVDDGEIVPIATTGGEGATWGDDGTIVFVLDGRLYTVPATAGGEPEPFIQGRQSGRYAQPHMLPGSETVLFHVMASEDPSQAEIVALDLATKELKTVLQDAMDPRYVPTGHLLFMREGALMAVGFDLERLEVHGPQATMVPNVMQALHTRNSLGQSGAAQVAVSASGHLAYAPGGIYPELPRTLVRIRSAGEVEPLDVGMSGEHSIARVSPGGDHLAFVTGLARRNQIWVRDLVRGQSRRLDTGGFSDYPMEWSPDGRFLVFSSDRDQGFRNLYRLAVDGSDEPERLAPSERGQTIASWSSEGVIAWLEGGDIWVLPPGGEPAPFFTSAEFEAHATFSPDGQWLAYRARERAAGQGGIYVRPYPGPEPATLISDRGSSPVWSPDGRQIYYVQFDAGDGVMWAVDVSPGDDSQVGGPAPYIDPWTFGSTNPVRSHDVFPDGSFVGWVVDPEVSVADFQASLQATEVHIVLNWFTELRERLPD